MNKTWPTKKLSDVCNLERGTEPGSAFYVKTSDKATPFFRVGDLTGKVDAPRFVKNDNGNLQIINENETLITFDGTPGIVVRGFKGAIASGIRVVRNIKPEIDRNFLFYYLQTPGVKKTIKAYSKGATIIHASSAIQHIKISLPSLATQKQIVGRLDKIVEAQKLNDELIQKANELFQSLLHEELNPTGKDWGVKKLGEVLKPQYGYTTAAKETGNYRFIRITDIGDDGELRDSDKKYVTLSQNEAKNYQLQNGDLLLARTGATFGKILYFKENESSIFASFLIRLNPDTSVDPFYIWLFSRSQNYWQQAKSLMTGSGQPQFNANKLKQIKIPFPPLKIQKQIVAKLSAVQEYKKQLLEQKSKLKELFGSVLAKSLSGDL